MWWIIGDLHYKIANAADTNLLEERLLPLIRESKPDGIFCMGDQLDRHENIHVDPLDRITTFLDQLRQIAPLFILIGNHDRPNNSNFLTTAHPFNAMKLWPDTFVIDDVTEVELDGRLVLMVPYVPKGRFMEALLTKTQLEKLETPGHYSFILAHQEFRNSKMGAIRSEDGDEWPNHYPYVISGHIHDYEQLQPNLLYVGTPHQLTFSDGLEKTVSTLTFTEERGLSFGRVNLRLPKKLLLYMSCEQVANYVPETNADTRIVVSGTSAELNTTFKLPAVKKLKAKGIKIKGKCIPVTYTTLDEPTLRAKVRQTYSERLREAAQKEEGLWDLLNEILEPEEAPEPPKATKKSKTTSKTTKKTPSPPLAAEKAPTKKMRLKIDKK